MTRVGIDLSFHFDVSLVLGQAPSPRWGWRDAWSHNFLFYLALLKFCVLCFVTT